MPITIKDHLDTAGVLRDTGALHPGGARAVRQFSHSTRKAVARAVNGVSFSLQSGRILAILSESGSRKSVLLQAILGLQAAVAWVSGELARQLFGGSLSLLAGIVVPVVVATLTGVAIGAPVAYLATPSKPA